MEKIMEQILSRLNSMDEKIGLLTSDMSTVKSDVQALKSDTQALKSDIQTLKSDTQALKSDIQTLKGDVQTVKSDIHTLKGDVYTLKNSTLKSERTLNAVFEQTGLLTEFKTEITKKLDKIITDNLSLQHVIGEHEIAIRSIRRIAF